ARRRDRSRSAPAPSRAERGSRGRRPDRAAGAADEAVPRGRSRAVPCSSGRTDSPCCRARARRPGRRAPPRRCATRAGCGGSAGGYERMQEEDVVRLQWWGLYHDKPKIGTFMLRVKIPSGIIEPAKLRAIGEVSNRYGRGDAELTTRQCIQLHWLDLASLPDV